MRTREDSYLHDAHDLAPAIRVCEEHKAADEHVGAHKLAVGVGVVLVLDRLEHDVPAREVDNS